MANMGETYVDSARTGVGRAPVFYGQQCRGISPTRPSPERGRLSQTPPVAILRQSRPTRGSNSDLQAYSCGRPDRPNGKDRSHGPVRRGALYSARREIPRLFAPAVGPPASFGQRPLLRSSYITYT